MATVTPDPGALALWLALSFLALPAHMADLPPANGLRQMSPAALQRIWGHAASLGLTRDGWERVRVDGDAAVLQRPGRAVHLDVPALSAYGVEPGWYDAQPPK